MKPKLQREAEETLSKRIVFIGNEIPKFFMTDSRNKQLYLGYPQQIIDELNIIIEKAYKEGYEKGYEDAIKQKNLTISILMKQIKNLEKK